MKQVRIEYFAILREQAGRREETVQTNAPTVAELYDELRVRHGFEAGRDALKVAVNDEFGDWETALDDDDTVVFIPPVAGG